MAQLGALPPEALFLSPNRFFFSLFGCCQQYVLSLGLTLSVGHWVILDPL